MPLWDDMIFDNREALEFYDQNGRPMLLSAMEIMLSKKPRDEIDAKAYKKVLSEFDGRFRHIEFAVFCTPRSRENYDMFKKVLGK